MNLTHHCLINDLENGNRKVNTNRHNRVTPDKNTLVLIAIPKIVNPISGMILKIIIHEL